MEAGKERFACDVVRDDTKQEIQALNPKEEPLLILPSSFWTTILTPS